MQGRQYGKLVSESVCWRVSEIQKRVREKVKGGGVLKVQERRGG